MPMLFVQERPEDNLYARPLEGIRMKLDLWATPPAVVAFLDAQVTLTLALTLILTLTLTLTLTSSPSSMRSGCPCRRAIR